MTRIAYISDLHLEFYERTTSPMKDLWTFMDPQAVLGSDVLILGGDICSLHTGITLRAKYFLDSCIANVGQVFWIMGNHEYYGAFFPLDREIREDIEDTFGGKIEVVDRPRSFVLPGGIRAFMGSAWTPLSSDPFKNERIRKSIADFSEISGPSGTFRAHECIEEFEKFRKEYIDYCLEHGTPDIVATHFVPTYESVSVRFRSGPGAFMNDYFCNGILDDPKIPAPKHWIHGHTHDPFHYVHRYGTEVHCNPYGYPGERRPKHHNPAAVIDINPEGKSSHERSDHSEVRPPVQPRRRREDQGSG